jgi:hypothetical protein
LLAKGKHKEVYRKEKGHVMALLCEIAGEPVAVRRDEVSQYVEDPAFLRYYEIYHYTKLWGLPNGKGWANEPMDVLVAISALEMEAKAIEAEELDNAGKHNSSTSTGQYKGRTAELR